MAGSPWVDPRADVRTHSTDNWRQGGKSAGRDQRDRTRNRLLHRAREIAGRIANLPPLTASYTRVALTQKLRRVIDESVGYGLALEGISAADVACSRAP